MTNQFNQRILNTRGFKPLRNGSQPVSLAFFMPAIKSMSGVVVNILNSPAVLRLFEAPGALWAQFKKRKGGI